MDSGVRVQDEWRIFLPGQRDVQPVQSGSRSATLVGGPLLEKGLRKIAPLTTTTFTYVVGEITAYIRIDNTRIVLVKDYHVGSCKITSYILHITVQLTRSSRSSRLSRAFLASFYTLVFFN